MRRFETETEGLLPVLFLWGEPFETPQGVLVKKLLPFVVPPRLGCIKKKEGRASHFIGTG